MKKLIILYFKYLPSLACFGQNVETDLIKKAEIPYDKGESRKIFNAKPSPECDENNLFFNDHYLVKDKDGPLHRYGTISIRTTSLYCWLNWIGSVSEIYFRIVD